MCWIVSKRNTCSDRVVLHCGQYGAAHSTPTGSFTNACKLLVHFQSLRACHHSWFQINSCMLATHSSFSNPNKRACNRSQCTGGYVHLIGFIQEIHRFTFTRCFLIVWSRMAMSKKQSFFYRERCEEFQVMMRWWCSLCAQMPWFLFLTVSWRSSFSARHHKFPNHPSRWISCGSVQQKGPYIMPKVLSGLSAARISWLKKLCSPTNGHDAGSIFDAISLMAAPWFGPLGTCICGWQVVAQ